MAIQGRQITLVYRALRHGQLFDDDPKLHTVMLLTNDAPVVPQEVPRRCGLVGHYIVQFGGHQTGNLDSLVLAGTSQTDGVLLEALPSVHPVALPTQKPGQPGGLVIAGSKHPLAIREDGSVMVGGAAKHALGMEAFAPGTFRVADNGLSDKAIAKGALSPSSFSDDFAVWLRQTLLGSNEALSTKAGHVRIVNGEGNGELRTEKGAVQALTKADKDGAVLSAESIQEVAKPLLENWQRVYETIATTPQIRDLSHVVADAISRYHELEAMVKKFDASHQGVNLALAAILESLTAGVRASLRDIDGNAEAAQALRMFLTEGASLKNSSLGGVDGIAKPVAVKGPVDANLTAVGGKKEFVELLLDAGVNASSTVPLNVTIVGQQQPVQLSGEDVARLAALVLEFFNQPQPPLSAAPPLNASPLEKVNWIYMKDRLPRHTENGKEELRADNGKSTIAVRSTTEQGTHATGVWR